MKTKNERLHINVKTNASQSARQNRANRTDSKQMPTIGEVLMGNVVQVLCEPKVPTGPSGGPQLPLLK